MRFLIILTMFLFSSVIASDMLDVDYNFIEHAFENTKPVSEQDFQKAINAKTPQPVPDTFGGKLKAFLFGRKYGVDTLPPSKIEQSDPVSEAQLIQEAKNGVYFIKLLASVVGEGGKIIPLGNYKIKEKEIDNKSMLVFYQGHEECGMLRLYRYNDTQKHEHDLTYSRVDIVSPELIRIVYATLDDTKCALARVYLQN
ncbi:hypothetical protein IJ531_00890 [bacterium]|nr:hypothetical protein [bacterium]